MEIGTVISTLDSPSPSRVNFVVDSNGPVHRGQFIEMDYTEGTLIALVNNVVEIQEVILAGGVSDTVTFKISEDVARSYSVNINGLSGNECGEALNIICCLP